MPPRRINEIVHSKRSISADTFVWRDISEPRSSISTFNAIDWVIVSTAK